MTIPIKSPKKLIEVALPLDAINVASAREKSIRHGHPSAIHLWWARRPLASARAVLFAQMVNDPGYQQGSGFRYGVNKERATLERERLFKIIEDLVQWENINNEEVLERARAEIWRSWRETCELNRNHPLALDLFNPEVLPGFHDPFAGGGAIPFEAQRLGLESFASDLNPVAVTINKAMIEIPPRFANRAPVGPLVEDMKQARLHEDWHDVRGLAEDVRRYGAWMRVQAEARIGSLYPRIVITPLMALDRPELKQLVGKSLTVITWLWARTVNSPNPAFSHVEVPLVSSFVLSTQKGKEAYVQPVIEGGEYRFEVKTGIAPDALVNGTKLARGGNFRCLLSDAPMSPAYIKGEGMASRMGSRLLALVVDSPLGRIYLSPSSEVEGAVSEAKASWRPMTPLADDARAFTPIIYGFTKFGDLFSERQLIALNTFAELVGEAIQKCRRDGQAAGMPDDGVGLDAGGTGATAYAQAVGVYLGLSASKASTFLNTLSRWRIGEGKTAPAFGRQAIAMVWDYAEINPFAGAGGDFEGIVAGTAKTISTFAPPVVGWAGQSDAKTQSISRHKVVSTDPPYYDNVGYAELSDFFYPWLRKCLRDIYPDLYATLAVPKTDELVAAPHRQGGRSQAVSFFLDGMTEAMHNIAVNAHPAFPVPIFYAFRQSDTDIEDDTSNTGWETFLEAVIKAGFAVTGTWPMRTESSSRLRGQVSNALASSIVLVCRRRDASAVSVSRREFIRELNAALPDALDEMTRGGVNSPVAPVDLSQAIIGPGMAIFSQYAVVLEADGTPMRVKTALQLINRFLAEDDFDHDTQFCLHWFEQQGWATGKFGEADVLARAKGTSVDALKATGVVASGKGDLRLLRWVELPVDWAPEMDTRLPVWEALHHLIRTLNQGGESAAGALLARMPARSEAIRALAYRLYTLCERKGWADDARAYNELVTAWSAIEQAAGEAGLIGAQAQLDI